MAILVGPSWDLSNQFVDLHDPKIAESISRVKSIIGELGKDLEPFTQWLAGERGLLGFGAVELFTTIQKKRNLAKTLLGDLITYCSCRLSVDSTLNEAKKVLGTCDALEADLNVALKPLSLWVIFGEPQDIATLLEHPAVESEAFAIKKLRKLRDQTLSLEQESLIEQMEIHGPLAFSRLYDDLTGILKVNVDTGAESRQAGLAEAANWLMSHDESLRKSTYQGIDQAFRSQEQSFGAIINHITGWRQSVLKLRSFKTKQHYLNPPLHQAHLSSESLTAMMTAVAASRGVGQKALGLQAQLLNKPQLDPWDLMAPCPEVADFVSPKVPFADGIAEIKSAFGQLAPEMADFVTMMEGRRWIDGSVGPVKRPGAYCTQFLETREPRVYMTYEGSLSNLSTLAHELGHAMHFWLMRDLPLVQLDYPMTLAETASIFAESLLVDHLLETYRDQPKQQLALLWECAGDAATFLLNIPARFTMESQFHEFREKSLLTPDDLRRITGDAWRHWYGPSLSEPNAMFWATKLHFSIGSLSFYNFPYTFGYLFSLSVFARRADFGKGFYAMYKALLRDTGRFTAEEVAKKHLGEDISKPEFWMNALKIVAKRVDQFAAAVAQVETKGAAKPMPAV